MIKHLFHIIRWPNLLMLVAIQWIVYYTILNPGSSLIKPVDFMMLTFITALIAASGYVINDYYDVQIDRINRPHRWIAGNTWSMNQVRILYILLVLLGGLLSFLLASRLNLKAYFAIYPLSVMALWLYSYALKCKPILGNLWVALFCAGVVYAVVLPDALLNHPDVIKSEVWIFMVFAFISTFYREIIKDLEDEDGDRELNCHTFVVRFGGFYGKILSLFAGGALVATLLWWNNILTGTWLHIAMYAILGTIILSIALMWFAKDKRYFHLASTLIKAVMMAGTLLLFFID